MGGNFSKIYGQYRRGYIIITLSSKGGGTTSAEEIGEEITLKVIDDYPLSEGKVNFIAGPSDVWTFMTFYFKNGEITERNTPNKDLIRKKKIARKSDTGSKFGLTVKQRERFCHDYTKTIGKSLDQAESKYGSSFAPGFPDEFQRIFSLEEKRLWTKYGVTKKQAGKIYDEGEDKGWL